MAMFAQCMVDYSGTTIEEDARVLAIESITGTAGGVFEVFSRIIPKAADAITALAEPVSAFLSPSAMVSLSSANKTLLRDLNKVPYASYRDILVQVPEGFSGNLVHYVQWLKKMQHEAVSTANALLNDYSTELSMFLSSVDYRKTLKSHERFYSGVSKQRKEFTASLASYFKKDSVTSRAQLGSVITRFGDLETLFKETEDLKNAVDFRKEVTKMLASVNHASGLLSLLKDKLEDKSLDGVSGDMAKHLAQGAYECGKYVELISILIYHGESASSSVKAIAEQLTAAIK